MGALRRRRKPTPFDPSLDCRAVRPQIIAIGCMLSGRRAWAQLDILAHRWGERRMSRLSLFNSPLLLGFDHFERALDRVSKVSNDGYPPYNIEQIGDNALQITLAVAGFTMADLNITVEDNQLVIRGRLTDDGDRVYLHRGIAARQFQRSFVLAEGIEVSGAWLDNGLLHVDLVRPELESRVRTVEIRSGGATENREAKKVGVARKAVLETGAAPSERAFGGPR
jgi:HSP20 family molecular chaperone IbpA